MGQTYGLGRNAIYWKSLLNLVRPPGLEPVGPSIKESNALPTELRAHPGGKTREAAVQRQAISAGPVYPSLGDADLRSQTDRPEFDTS